VDWSTDHGFLERLASRRFRPGPSGLVRADDDGLLHYDMAGAVDGKPMGGSGGSFIIVVANPHRS